MASPIVLIGTGTSVGKTHVAERLLRAFGAEGRKAYGYKPIESGVDGSTDSDSERLARASTFHVKHEPARTVFRAPVSPHLAARAEGVPQGAFQVGEVVVRGEAPEAEHPGGKIDAVQQCALRVQLAAGAWADLSTSFIAPS